VLKVSETTTSFSTDWSLGTYTAWLNLPIPKETISENDFTKFSEFPYYVMGYTPTFDATNGLNSENPGGWYQYFVADGIHTIAGKAYAIEVEIKGDGEGSFNANMGWGWNDGQQISTTVSFSDKWETKQFTFAGPVEAENCYVVFQPGMLTTPFYVRNLKVIEPLSVEKEITIVDNPNTTVSDLSIDSEIPADALENYTFSYSGSLNGEYKWVSGVPFKNLTIEPAIDYTNFTDWQYRTVTYRGRTKNCNFKVYKLIDKMELLDVPTEIYQNEQITGKVHITYKDKTDDILSLNDLSNYKFGYYVTNGWNILSTSELGTKDIFLNYHNAQSNTVTITVKADPNEPQKDSKGNYKIATAGNLLWFNRYVKNQDSRANAVLTDDIVFNDNLLDGNGNLNEENIVNVWNSDFYYYGTFDGRGYTISGLYIVSEYWCAGSFCNGVENNATIQNLGLIDCYIEKEYNRAGICCYNNGTISNCFTSGTTLDYGLCYENYRGVIKNSYSLCPLQCLIYDNYGTVENCYENSDFKTKYGEPRWGLTLSTEELCNGKLPDGFSSQLWSAGRIEGDTYIFPQLKKFANPVSITPGDVEISLPEKSEYEIGDKIDLSGAKVGKAYRGFVISGDQKITENNVTGFSTEKVGEFTAKIKVGNTSEDYPYIVKKIDHIQFWGYSITQNSDLSEEGFTIYYTDGTEYWCQLSNPNAEIHNFDVTKVGVYENAYITYKGFSSTCWSQVYEPIESFDLSNVSTEIYQYERLSGKVIIHYENGETEEKDITEINDNIFSTIGNTNAGIWYNGYYQKLAITVKSNPNQPTQVGGVYQIGTAEQLYWFANYVNAQKWDERTMNAVLTADIVLNENLLDENGELIESNALKNWTPIANYRGTFDGQGHTISGLYLNQQNEAGFTSSLYGTIKNLGIVDCYVKSENGYACAISSYANPGSNIVGCYSTGKVVSNSWVAGICVGMCTPQNCYSLCELQTTGESYMRCGIAENSDATSFINSDYNENLWSSRGAISLSTADLCNGQLPEGFSSDIWNAGSIKGNVYTYPQLKVFKKAVSFTLPNKYTLIVPKGDLYKINDVIDYSNMFVGKKIPGTSVFINKEDVQDNNPTVSDFSTTKPGTYTATITCKGATAQYTYKVGAYDKPYFDNNYYFIRTVSELMWFADFVNSGNTTANAYIDADITLNENLVEKVKNGQTSDLIVWTPIGTKENPYDGVLSFNRESYTISGLYVNNPEQDYVGFIGYCKSSRCEYAHIEDSYFAGHNYVGGIYGYCEQGPMRKSHFTGSVSGNDYVGGLVGYFNAPISNSYVSAEIIGNNHTGAIAGYNRESITNCYYNNSLCNFSADDQEGKIEGKNESAFHSGEVAYLLDKNVEESNYYHWCQDLSENNVFPKISEKKTLRVHKDIVDNGYHNAEYYEEYPTICKICMPVVYQAPEQIDGVYQISTKDHLLWFMQSRLLGYSYNAKLTADIEFNDTWYSSGNNYESVFDGDYHKITGLKSENTTGMFNGLNSNGEIKNLILVDADFKGSSVGGIVYNNLGTITNCVFDGEINAIASAGGICESNYGTISGCINAGKITARYAGGIARWQGNYGGIEQCYNTGEIISAEGNAGGIICEVYNTYIMNCYNVGKMKQGGSIMCHMNFSIQYNLQNVYNNSDVCNLPIAKYDGVNFTGGFLTSAEFCTDEVPGGFSSDIWVAGTMVKKDGKVTYTFPHLKALAKAYNPYVIEDTYEREVESIEIKTYPQKLTYIENEELDFSDGELFVKYNYGDNEVISLTSEGVEISDPNRELEYFNQEQTLTVTYQGQECLLKGVKIIELQLLGINLTAPTKETYILGQELNLEGGKLELLWNDNDNEIYDLAEDNNDEELSIIIPNDFTTQEGKKTITVKYENFEKSFTVNVVARTVAAIKISTNPDNTEYYQTHDYDLSGGKLEVSYEGLTITDELDLTSSDITIVGYDAYTLGAQTLKVVYMGKITELPVTVKERKVSSVSISKIPPKDTYNQGDAIDGSDGKIKVVYENEDEEIISMTDDGVSFSINGDTENKDVYVIYGGVMSNDFFTVEFKTPERTISSIEMGSYPQYEYSGKESLNINGGWIKVNYTEGEPDWIALSNENVSVSEMDPTIIDEEQIITVTYCGKSTSFAIKIIKSLTDVELVAPTKTDYVVGQTLSLTGGKIVYNYNDGSEEIVDLIDDKVMVSGYNSETAAENLPVTVTYNNERIGVFYVNIVDKKIKNIVFQEPTKLKYVQGQSLDLTGGYIKYEYNDGSYETVDLTDDMVLGFNSDEPNDELKVSVTYGDYHKFFFVNITAKTVTDVRFTAPTKRDYIQGQALDLNDAYLTVAYNNGDVDVVYLSDDMVEGFDSSLPAENGQTVTVKPYKGFSNFDRTFVVKIAKNLAKEITSIVLTAPTKTDYIQGQALDLTGGSLTITYNDDEVKKVDLTANMINDFDVAIVGDNRQVSVKPYEGYSDFVNVFTVNYEAKVVAELVIVTNPTKLTYVETEQFDITGLKVKAVYNDGEEKVINNTELAVDATSWNVTNTNNKVTISFGNKSKDIPVTVIAKAVSSITVTAPTKTEYKKGEESLDLTGGKIVATYNDGDKKDFDLLAEYVSGFDNSALNNALPVTVTFEGKTNRFYVKIVPAKEILSIAITKQPAKLTYFEGESLSVSDGELTITYSDNSTEKVSLSLATIAKPAGTGSQNLKVAYIGKETTLSVTVKAKELESIALTTKPTKLEYIEGQVLDLTGGVLTLTYNDNSTETITLPSSDVTVSGFDATQVKVQTITLTYEGKTATFDVEVIAKVISSIAVTTKPTKLEYIEGQSLDVIGGVLTATYNDNSTETVNLKSENVKVSGFDATQTGKQTITVEYGGKTATFEVIVNAEQLVEIEVTTLPTKVEYIEGQELEISGGVLTLTFDNNTTSTVNFDDKDVKISGFDKTKTGEQTITVEYSGKTAEFKVKVNNKQLVKVEIVKVPQVEYAFGEALNLKGGVIKATFDNGDEMEVDLSYLTVSGYDANKAGKQTLTAEYKGQTITFDVTVKEEEKPENPDDPNTATEDIVATSNVKIWSFENTVYVENAANEIVIVDMSGRVVKRINPTSDRMEIQLNKGGIYIIKTGLATKKVSVQ
jgi:hypothetical protein